MSWVLQVASQVKHAFDLYFCKEQECRLLRLTADIFVDEVFVYLFIEDLLSVRMTCKGLYLLTHQPIIWKRYMRRLHVPLVQLRPTFKFTERASNYEIEYLVTRACALERSWHSNFPKVHSTRVLATQYKIIDLKLLPGGKFLIASAKDRCNYRFYILVYALDVMFGSRMIARLPTFFKVYDLQSRYLDYQGRPGIMIAYTRRRFRDGAPMSNINIADFSHRNPLDIGYPLVYETVVTHMDLENIEQAIWPSQHPWAGRARYLDMARSLDKPFHYVMRREYHEEVHSPSFFVYQRQPFLGVAVGTSHIHLTRLADGKSTFATLSFKEYPGYSGLPHRIRAWRFIPCQNSVMVFRSICMQPQEPELHIVEFFQLPEAPGAYLLDAEYGYQCAHPMALNTNFTIADPVDPWQKMGEDHPDPNPNEVCPPTIWAFASLDGSKGKSGSVFWGFRPERVAEWGLDREKWVYKCADLKDNPRTHINTFGLKEYVLPGSERTLLYECDRGRKDGQNVVKFRRFIWPKSRFLRQYPNLSNEVTYPITNMGDLKPDDFAFGDLEMDIPFELTIKNAGGMSAITWDEMSGRMAIALEDQDNIWIRDLAPVCEPHHRLAYRWQEGLVNPDASYGH